MLLSLIYLLSMLVFCISGTLFDADRGGRDDRNVAIRDVSPTTIPVLPADITQVSFAQSSMVTTLAPQAVICAISSIQAGNTSAAIRHRHFRRSTWAVADVNDTLVTPDPANCTVAYAGKVISLCNTTIPPLGDMPITISDCDQEITFRTDHGQATLRGGFQQMQTTKYVATWSDVVTGVPTGIVKAEVCGDSGSCNTFNERWDTRAVVVASTTTSTVHINTIITGLAVIFLGPYDSMTVTEPTSLSLSSELRVVQSTTSMAVDAKRVEGTMSEVSTLMSQQTPAINLIP